MGITVFGRVLQPRLDNFYWKQNKKKLQEGRVLFHRVRSIYLILPSAVSFKNTLSKTPLYVLLLQGHLVYFIAEVAAF